MKKILILILLLLLVGCKKSESEYKIITPNGMPSIAQSLIEYNQAENNYLVERVSGPQSLVAAFTNNTHDFIIAPLNLGANLYQKNSTYKLASIITWGNLQFVSHEEITDLSDLDGKDIIAFGENTVNQMIIETIIDNYDFENTPNIDYQASSTQESMTMFLQDETIIAVMAEPTTSIANTMTDSLYILDIGDLWSQINEEINFPQAGVFVNESLTDTEINNYLNALETSVNYVLENPVITGSNCETMEYPFSSDIITSSINPNIINLKLITDIKPFIENFYQKIYDFNPTLIGEEIPDDNFYWIE
ncbi:MAG: hypothetical protein ACOCUD_02375 [Bacillota bacterium]